ncbi:hypothetical protein [Rhodococcus sp. 2G]|uniref:hypothetical protein n=1 Tax=Rhodococcus TaxID=1827 RepID=UPI000903C15D|nr:hypothetical protein [Rhodococcus sp. 2G]APE11564.1 hypothetical protein BO226_22105 [Rhodococcus sp. 2G]
MGYAYYTLPDGRDAGYGVEAECDHPDCHERINRGLGYLCGEDPDGHRDPEEPGCGKYYCEQHSTAHECTNPACGVYSDDEELICGLAKGHELPHRDPIEEQDFGPDA